MILLIASLIASIRLLWIVLGRPVSQLGLFCFCLTPVLACIATGQLGIFLLLGISLFLYLYTRHSFLAGTSLLVCAFKPHLFLCFGIALIFWAIDRKQYRVMGGMTAAILAACGIALCFNIHAFSQYATMMAIAHPTEIPYVPTLSRLFRLALHPSSVWLQFVPVVAGCCWTAWYYMSSRDRWNWTHEGIMVLVVSVGCAPYAWLTDVSVLVAAILAGLYRAQQSGRSLLPFAVINFALLAELTRFWITTPYLVWSVPAWLAWYMYSSHGRRPEAPECQKA
jgi:hypothetical protein